MNNKLPKVFKNTLDKQIDNNEKVYMTKNGNINTGKIKTVDETKKINNQKKEKSSLRKVEDTLSKLINKQTHYTYRIPVEIELQDRKIVTKIIGKTKNSILTIDNEKIEIKKIKNIITIEN